MEQSTVKGKEQLTPPKPEPKKKLEVSIGDDGKFSVQFSVKKGEIPITRRELTLILRAINVQYGIYSRHILLQERLKKQPQGVTNAVA